MSSPAAQVHGPEQLAPYRTGPADSGQPVQPPKRIRIPALRAMKDRGERWPMLTAYDVYTAEIFDESGIPVLLVGD
jgi:3-methyl-2-oxobutanoate hydroxymethyltransferase